MRKGLDRENDNGTYPWLYARLIKVNTITRYCRFYQDFRYRGVLLTKTLLIQGFQVVKLKVLLLGKQLQVICVTYIQGYVPLS
jgi:hypothetical protein